MKRYTVRSTRDTEKFVKTFTESLRGGDVVGLIGPLGAGKTTMVQMVARELGMAQRPRSPSYTLLQPYPLPKPIRGITTLVHVDAYRIGGADLLEAGLADFLYNPETLVLIEWTDRLPSDVRLSYTVTLRFGRVPTARTIMVEKKDAQ